MLGVRLLSSHRGEGGGSDLKIDVGKHKPTDSPAIIPPLLLTAQEKWFFTHRFDSNSAQQSCSEEEDCSLSSSVKTRVGVEGVGKGGTFHPADGGETKMDKEARAAHLQCAKAPPGGDKAQRTGGAFRQLKV